MKRSWWKRMVTALAGLALAAGVFAGNPAEAQAGTLAIASADIVVYQQVNGQLVQIPATNAKIIATGATGLNILSNPKVVFGPCTEPQLEDIQLPGALSASLTAGRHYAEIGISFDQMPNFLMSAVLIFTVNGVTYTDHFVRGSHGQVWYVRHDVGHDVASMSGIFSNPSSSSGGGVHGECTKGHDFQYHVFIEPTTEYDGIAAWACTRCGFIDKHHEGVDPDADGLITLDAYPVFNGTLIKEITDAPENGTVKIETARWTGMKRTVLEALAKHPDVTLQVQFRYNGADFLLTISGSNPKLAEVLATNEDYPGFCFLGGYFPVTNAPLPVVRR